MNHAYSNAPRPRLLATLGFGAALLLAAATTQAQTVKYEAESPANTLAGTGIAAATDITGYSGTGYVNYAGNTGLSITFPVTAAAAGDYNLIIRYESQYGTTAAGNAKIGAYSVNGGTANTVYLNGTAPGIAGNNFKSTTALRVTLKAGANTIKVSDNAYGYFGVDYISLAPAAAGATLTPSATGRVEAEAGQLKGVQGLVRDDDMGTYSGTGYVGQFNGNSPSSSTITLPVTVATAGLYQISVGARALFDGKSFDVAVTTGTTTGGPLTTAVDKADPAFASFAVAKYNLTAGTNTITLSSQTGYLEVDYVDIVATTGDATPVRASAAAQKALSAYPNPTNGRALSISLDLASAQQTTFDLVNTLGQRVSSETHSLPAGSNRLQLPTTSLSAGIYQLVVRSGNQPVLVQRVVVN